MDRMHSLPNLAMLSSREVYNIIALLASESLTDEVYTTPKPGLVDCANSGSHEDMDLALFERSIAVLEPYWAEFASVGGDTALLLPEEAFEALQKVGICAEKAMLGTTCGVNTHKGAIFALGTLCGAAGRLWQLGGTISVDGLLNGAAELSCGFAARHWREVSARSESPCTAGERFYLQYGVEGICGEVSQGFPSVKEGSLPIYHRAVQDGFSANDAGVAALLWLIAQGKDTNMISRGGWELAQNSAAQTRVFLQEGLSKAVVNAKRLDQLFIQQHLSPGGCADLLAVTYFLCRIEELDKRLNLAGEKT